MPEDLICFNSMYIRCTNLKQEKYGNKFLMELHKITHSSVLHELNITRGYKITSLWFDHTLDISVTQTSPSTYLVLLLSSSFQELYIINRLSLVICNRHILRRMMDDNCFLNVHIIFIFKFMVKSKFYLKIWIRSHAQHK